MNSDWPWAPSGAVFAPLSLAAREDEGLEMLWLPFVAGTGEPFSAVRWGRVLNQVHIWRPETEMPVFANRAKSFAALDALEDTALADSLREKLGQCGVVVEISRPGYEPSSYDAFISAMTSPRLSPPLTLASPGSSPTLRFTTPRSESFLETHIVD